MKISAILKNSYYSNEVLLETNGNEKSITIASKPEGYGSAINGGELLLLSLATCFCNDVYREAAKRKLKIDAVEVTVTGNFGAEGEPASKISYHVQVQSASAGAEEINDLIRYVDRVAEVHNTLRKGIALSITSPH